MGKKGMVRSRGCLPGGSAPKLSEARVALHTPARRVSVWEGRPGEAVYLKVRTGLNFFLK